MTRTCNTSATSRRPDGMRQATRPLCLLILALSALLVGAGCASSRSAATPATVTTSRDPSPVRLPQATPAGETTLYGHITSLARTGRRFEMRFDPALWLTGVTAGRAAVEDKAIAPGEPVSNDYYIRDASHRLLTYEGRLLDSHRQQVPEPRPLAESAVPAVGDEQPKDETEEDQP